MTELFVPNILIVALSWVTFCLHPLAVPGRVSLGAVTVLTMSSQGSATRQNAPKVSSRKTGYIGCTRRKQHNICWTTLCANKYKYINGETGPT
jgi:hypothetical protein